VNNIFTKQKNEGLYLLDWFAWHQAIGVGSIHIVSNDCNDHSDTMLDVLSEENPDIQHINVTDEPLSGRSVGQRTTSKLNELVLNNRDSFAITMDVDEYICFREPKVTDISYLNFARDKSYHLPWLNCLPEDAFNNSGDPPYQRSTKAITKKNDAFPYFNGYQGKQLRYNHEGVTLENFHHFSVNGEELKQGEASGIYLKHCVTNTLDEFMLRGERGEAAIYATGNQNIAEREKNAYKYAIDLFLMYISQETTPNILPNKVIADKAADVKADLLSNPKIKAAQDKIDAYYKRKFSKIKKSYIPSIFRELNIQHIDDLKTKELEKFNKQFFTSKSKKPHDFYVLMSLANLFEKNHSKARQYATEGLMIYPSFKLLLMAQSSILQNPYYAVP
jgi:hypothetical protein